MAKRLQTYLRTYRKRSALTQDELSSLLGCKSGVSVCEYERLKERPSLETALACQAIFGVSVEELFPGIYEKVVNDVVQRARVMSKQWPEGDETPAVKLKKQLLAAITRRYPGEHENNVCNTEIATSPVS